eukprot:Sspe_Gene.69448::Locus_40935_Transcript_1_1_Confidence_1.000_Length_549::g.69448::m.69448
MLSPASSTGLPMIPMNSGKTVAYPTPPATARPPAGTRDQNDASPTHAALSPPMTPRPPVTQLGVGTQGLGPSCNVLIRRYERETQKRWLFSRTRLMNERAAQEVVRKIDPKEAYLSNKSERERQKTETEEMREKAALKNAQQKKDVRSSVERQRNEINSCIMALV